MGVANLVALNVATLTSQQLADFALEADQAARRARERGDSEAAEAYQSEADALAELSRK
jgi:hypothetical protein